MTSTRTDIHSPSNFTPEHYEFFDWYYVGGEEWALLANSPAAAQFVRTHKHVGPHGLGQCDHCGAYYSYGALFLHTPSGGYVAVGHDCAEGRFVTPPEFAAKRRILTKVIAGKRVRGKINIAVAELLDADPELADALEWGAEAERLLASMESYTEYGPEVTEEGRTYYRMIGFNVRTIRDISAKLHRYGSVSEKQVAFVKRLATEGAEKQVAAKRRVAEVAAMEPLTAGRQEIEGEIVSVKWQENTSGYGGYYGPGGSYKMLLALDSGHRVYGTVPSALDDVYQAAWKDGATEADLEGFLKGRRVRLSATVRPKGNDFGYFSRPTKPELL